MVPERYRIGLQPRCNPMLSVDHFRQRNLHDPLPSCFQGCHIYCTTTPFFKKPFLAPHFCIRGHSYTISLPPLPRVPHLLPHLFFQQPLLPPHFFICIPFFH